MKRLLALLLLALPLAAQTSDEFAKAVYFGKKFFDMKDYASAYDQFAKADQLQPDSAPIVYNMAVVLARAGRYSEAQAKVDRYVQLFPGGAERPMIQQLQLELDFQRELQKKRQAEQSYVDLFNRGKFAYTRNDLEAALKVFQEAEQQRPTDAAAVFNQAVIHEKLGDLAKASERFHRYEELESDAEAKGGVGPRLLLLESELEDMRTKIVCPFCGYRLPANGGGWCPRCWHGPYATASPVWNTRPCVDGATATRATYFSEGRFQKNDVLSCLFNGTMAESLRYSPAKQKQIQDARKSEGWAYNGEIIQGHGSDVRYVQGPDYLERIVAPLSGDILQFAAHAGAPGVWLLDREDVIIDDQKYTSRYTYDASNRIARQQVEYQNAAACNHNITMTADYAYQNDALVTVKLAGGYTGFVPEGSPKVDWTASVGYTYDANARVTKEELVLMSLNKMYTQRPLGALRDEINKLYLGMRPNRPIENAMRTGDLCATSGTMMLGNPIDLRPFYAMSPNLAMTLPFGVTRAVVTFTYPDSFRKDER